MAVECLLIYGVIYWPLEFIAAIYYEYHRQRLYEVFTDDDDDDEDSKEGCWLFSEKVVAYGLPVFQYK